MQIYNTRTREKEELMTQTPNVVKAYVCGPTVYDYSHIGHARTYVNFDVLKRYLEATGYEVVHIQNFTDVEEKITDKAREEGVDPTALANKYIGEYFKDMDALNVKRATRYPRASEYIGRIIEITKSLVAKGYAYQAGDAIYFEVSKAGGYGELIGNLKGALADKVDRTTVKKDPFDFVLWREAKEAEEGWESPWGRGRPGWHTECVAMAMDSLGEVLDVHWGGKDLIYPHHECEALIAKALTGKTFVRYWMHNEFVLLRGEKMSKSTGNTVPIHEILKRHSGEALRTLLLSKGYREKIDFYDGALDEAEQKHARIKMAAEQARKVGAGDKMSTCVRDYAGMFFGAMDDDLETGKAMAVVEHLSEELLSGRPGKDLSGAARIFDAVEGVLGIRLG
ncbi:MAG: cysteine--tRNA ligase [Candidatus Methanomethylicaceae archaeon]|jgi:cysteinyl-tRNA synthetase